MLKELVNQKIPDCAGPNPNMEALGGLHIGSKWHMLKPTDEIIVDPVNEFLFRAPKIEEGKLPTTLKHNYAEKIDCPVFFWTEQKERGSIKR